jgi:pyruvate/2-oxoglutarate dehydrogenase complex dihydrolipoamide acyltransferase (E2) component
VQNGQQQTQEDQYLQEALSFYGQAMGRVKSQVHNYRQQLEHYSGQLPEGGDAQAQIQEMIDSYSEIEGSMDQAAQDAGVQEAMSQAAQQTQQQMQEVAQGVAQQAQDTAGQVAGQAQEAAGQATEQAGQVAGQAQDAAGAAAQQAQDTAAQATQQATGGEDQQSDATNAAQQKAQELGVDLSQMQGSGAGGRITIRDVIGSSNQ